MVGACNESELTWSLVRKVSLTKYLSFSRQRLTRKKIAKIIPEVTVVDKFFGPRSLQIWNDEMLSHNALLQRGAKMMLCCHFSPARLMNCSLDIYMLHMHANSIAEVLDSLSRFGNGVMQHCDPDQKAWWLSPEISIQQAHWFQLCRRVIDLLKLLGFEPEEWVWPNFLLEQWRSRLFLAAMKAQETFGVFSQADSKRPAFPLLYGFKLIRSSFVCGTNTTQFFWPTV